MVTHMEKSYLKHNVVPTYICILNSSQHFSVLSTLHGTLTGLLLNLERAVGVRNRKDPTPPIPSNQPSEVRSTTPTLTHTHTERVSPWQRPRQNPH